MAVEWGALVLGGASACAATFAFWVVRKERDAGVRLNIFALLHPEGKPFPPFGPADFVGPALLVGCSFICLGYFIWSL